MKRMIRMMGCGALLAVVGSGVTAQADVASPPPAPILMLNEVAGKDAPAPQSYDIEVLFKQRKIWSGALRVAPRGNSSFNQQLSQGVLECPGKQANIRYGNVSESLRVNVGWQSMPAGNGVRVMVQIERPKMVCDATGTDTISLTRMVSLEAGQTLTIEGEGGLTVRMTRLPL